MSAAFEPVVGRYMHLDLFGRQHRIYLEQAGEGTPLLCLHTAGADGRQYRALMNEARITRRHRVIAFDMPWHGKSSPPAGWHNEEYQLTSAQYTTMILEIMAALDLDRPIVMGCSIGGRIALHLALEHPERFRAIIGLQAGAHVDPYYDLNFLHRARDENARRPDQEFSQEQRQAHVVGVHEHHRDERDVIGRREREEHKD